MCITNEGKACDAVIRYLENREGQERSNLKALETHHPAPVELICNIGRQLYAFEHTAIEPFEGCLQENAEEEKHYKPITDALCNALPTDSFFELHLPAKVFQGLKERSVESIQEAIIEWVRKTGPALEARSHRDRIDDIVPSKPTDVPFEVRLLRFKSRLFRPRFKIIHNVQADIEASRRERIQRACEKKFPKIAVWKRNQGARTVLIFESTDDQLTSESSVAKAFVPLARARNDQPDETFLVWTGFKPWSVCPLPVDGESWFDWKPSCWEVDPDELEPLTSR